MTSADDPLLWLTFDAAARSHPDAVAIVDGATSITYAALRGRALEHATTLTGLGHPRLVALVAHDPVETLAWFFGAVSTGATVAPVTPSEPDRSTVLGLLRADVTVACARDARVARAAAPARPLPAGVIVCTAGTTGTPKAVVHSHATLGHAVRRLQLFRLASAGSPARVPVNDAVLAGDLLDAASAPAWEMRYATTLPLTTIAGLTVAFQSLLAGDTLVLPSTTEPSALVDTLAGARVSNVSLTPLLAQLVLRAVKHHPRRLDHLLFAGIGGGPVAPAVPAALEAVIGCPVAVGYGTTEAGGAITMGAVTDPPAVRHGTVGRALPGVELAIDDDTRELAVQCASTAIGYLDASGELTEITRHRYATGDLARRRADGAIELRGRADALILRGGRNIDPVRIERALEDHPAVRRAAAFGVRNARVAGEQDIWTLVELDGAVAEADLRAHCSGALGAALTPRRVVAVDALPLTADGAVRRHELSRLAVLTTARSGAS